MVSVLYLRPLKHPKLPVQEFAWRMLLLHNAY